MNQQPLRLVATENRLAGLTPADLTEPESTTLIALALQVLAARHQPGQPLTSPDDTRAYLRLLFAERPNEVFVCLFLDVKHRLLAVEELFHGTIDGASVHPREVVRRSLEVGAGALILAHSHPSGVPEPSQADLRITEQLRKALDVFSIRVLDHLVVAKEGCVSFAERGLL
jgi:DNA repair protein RadC